MRRGMQEGWGRRLGRALRRLTFLSVLLAGAAGAAALILRPPGGEVPEHGGVLQGVTIVNPGHGRTPRQTVTVRGSFVAHVEDDHGGTAGGPFEGAYVLPGLIDMHVHFSGDQRALFGLLFLAHGVTTVRDAGSLDDSIDEIRRGIRDGMLTGPRVFTCISMIDGTPPSWPGARVVRDAEEAREAVAAMSGAGADCIKVHDHLTDDALAGVREAAAPRELPVIGHVPRRVGFAEAGLTDVQHLTGVPAPLFTDLTPEGWYDAWLDLPPGRIDEVVRISAAHGIAHTPTLVKWERLSHLLDGARSDPALSYLPSYYPGVIWNPEDGLPGLGALRHDTLERLGRVLPVMREVVRRLHEAGVRLHAGSDTPSPFVVPGASLQAELRLLVDSGLTVEEAWEAATRVAGESLGLPLLGVVAPGAPADLLVFREDPTIDLAALSTLEAVVADGRFYPIHVLARALERHRAQHDGALYDTVSTALVRPLLRWRFRGIGG